MAFFDFLLGGAQGQIKRHARRVANRDAQPEDRESSAAWLSDNGTDDALMGLCGRFALQLEHSLKDKKEKELVAEMLESKGEKGAEIARRWAAANPHYHYPVRIVERIKGSDEATRLLLDLLAGESVDNEFHPEKKRNLLISLAERRHPAILDAAAPFLGDFDEGVRHAAIEALAAQDGDAMRGPLDAARTNPKEESTRIRGRLNEIFQQRRWV